NSDGQSVAIDWLWRRWECRYSLSLLQRQFVSPERDITINKFEKGDLSQWKLGWNFRLLTAAYTGIVGTGINFILVTWCVGMRGPLFASVFNPLLLVIVAIVGSLMLDEKLYLGRYIYTFITN
ncbi:WAT1-related protein, partial [Trifolium medium]|nr:WAT1-related protein [Trifolium medium]